MRRHTIAPILCSFCLLLLVACGQSVGAAGTAGNAPAGTLPTALHVTLPPVPSPYATPLSLYHPIDKTISDAAAVQRLYAEAIALPATQPGTEMCQAEIPGLIYHLVFLNGSRVLRTADLDATGCLHLRFGPHDLRTTNPSFLTLFQQTLAM